MKIELITLHRVTNFGSLLQAYASQSILQKRGNTVEVIDFLPEGLQFKRALWSRGANPIKCILKLLPNLCVNIFQYSMADRFLRENVNLTKKKYNCYQELLLSPPAADIYASGSDQLWNTQNNNPPEDLKAYYLQFVPKGKRRIALSGSFGRYDFSEEEKSDIKCWLSSYDAISVREKQGLEFVESLGLQNAVHVLDPTLLLTGEEWREFVNRERPTFHYVFVYNLNRNKTVEKIAKIIAAKKNIQIVNFADTFEFIGGAKNRLFNTPKDLVYYINYADYVITDSFHGTAFSINLNTPFFSVPAPRFNSRLESILECMGLKKDRYVENMEEALINMDHSIDWEKVNCILSKEREKTEKYLEGALYGE